MSHQNIERSRNSVSESERDAKILKQGRKLFIREFDKQLEQLQSLIGVIQPEPDLSDLKKLYRIAHTLKGSAPVFGYTRIGKLSEDLVRIWEWTQSMECLNEPFIATSPIQESVERTTCLLHELRMELEISLTEIQMDELQHQSAISMLRTLKSRILLVDDDDALRSYLTKRLQLDECVVDEASNVDTAKKLLREHTYDLVTLDLMMHPQSGYELFEYLKEDPTLKWLPLIVLSGRDDVSDKVRCFHLGADDYVTKPFQYEELAARIYGLLKRTRNFEQLAFRDPLTGVFNRRYFDLQIGLELQRIERYPAPISLVFIDIDSFKSVNDTYGHHVGDLVLQGLAHRLQVNLRSTDLLARFGGEEFVIALPNTTVDQGMAIMQDILDKVRSHPVAQYEGRTFAITFSAGVAEWQVGMTIPEWVDKADDAMYQAKQQGKNRVLRADLEDEGAQFTKLVAHANAQLQKRKLLIVDDDPILRAILISQLEHLPITITQASDGEVAWDLLTTHAFDACILDGVLPRIDGFTLLEKMKADQDSHLKDMKVLMLSGKKKEDDVAKGLQMGADDYMTKPFSLVELETRVKRLMNLA
ncbi:response regulator [Paenibacillus roseipurpureus]|uniref:Response regulator n=1 Tax=Paenibacillus roseopurpureus TaxID=2918901 RepID=A0AA96RJU5_9BACL|nr:response regulator [Paenibacillus sp. MBLB1832]WNR43624.1 response regulator [Paenibacillus sp. MBLB1832]